MTAATRLPVAPSWYRQRPVTARIGRVDEPHVDPFLRANIWHVRGRDRDLVFDAGLGIVSLREAVPHLFAHSPILVVSHAHLDHVGSAHEFDDRRAAGGPAPVACSLRGDELVRLLALGSTALPDVLVDALPDPDFDVDAHRVPPFEPTIRLRDGDVIDLGDQRWRVLHLPGHSADSVCLFDEESGSLLSGDVVYDDELLDDVAGADRDAYARSLRRLRDLEVTTVYPGHDEPFDGGRLRAVIDAYLLRVTGVSDGADTLPA